MGADVSRVRFDPLRDFAGVVLQQGRLLLDADFNELRRAARPAAARGDVRPHVVRPRPRPGGRGVGAAPDARRLPRHGRRRAAHDRPRAHVRRRPARREPRQRAARVRPAALASATGTADTPYDKQPYWPTPDPLPTGTDRTSRTSTSGIARSRPSRIPISSRSQSASTRRRAGRRSGRCACCRTPATPRARPTTTRSPAGSTGSGPRPDG